jgi:hypothetical protein
VLSLAFSAFGQAFGQATPTAARALGISAFGGLSGVYTGLNSAKNLSITAGGDLSLRRYYGLNPALEVRGMYPVDSGSLVSERNILGGIRLSHPFARLNVYGDALFGRGELKYINGFIDPTGTIEYLQNPSNVFSAGGGVEYRLTDRFGVKADGQIQHYNTPVTTTGHLYSKPLTLAVVYHFNFGKYPIR